MNRQRISVLCGLITSAALLTAVFAAAPRESAQAQQATPNLPPVTVVAAPAATAAVAAQAGSSVPLPVGTLILLQRNQSIAQLPGGVPLSLQPEQFGPPAASTGKLGVRITRANGKATLSLIDLVSGQLKPIPNGANLTAPAIAWKKDASGFAFYDVALPGAVSPLAGAIQYYDVTTNVTRPLIPATAANATLAALGWSPDGKYLLYTVTTTATGTLAKPNSQALLYDLTANTSKPLPADAANFLYWDRTGQGFLTEQVNATANTSQIKYYTLAALTTPVILTPASTLDLLSDISPDGKRIVVSTSPGRKSQSAFNLAIESITAGDRKALTTFKSSDQAITGLVWATDGIYYSLSGATGDTTWHIDLDGQNAHQVALGTLLAIVGAH